MILGHLEENGNKINGNRMKSIVSFFELDNYDSVNTAALFEKYTFNPGLVASLMEHYGIAYTWTTETDERISGIVECTRIESDALYFYFEDEAFMSCYLKYNVLDELKEKYNLPE